MATLFCFFMGTSDSPKPATDFLSKSEDALSRARSLLMSRRTKSSVGPPRILIVEDSIDDRTRFEVEFRNTDFKLTFAMDADEARKLIAPDAFDLILIDMSLPGADGTAVVDRINKVAGLTPMAVVSGTIPNSYQKAFLAISKPVTPDKMWDIARKAVALAAIEVGKQL